MTGIAGACRKCIEGCQAGAGTGIRECDKMEHEGSMMFDEYPDRLLFRLLCRRICRELWDGGQDGAERIPDREDPRMQLVEVMLAQEMYRRRCRYRRCRRWYGTV